MQKCINVINEIGTVKNNIQQETKHMNINNING